MADITNIPAETITDVVVAIGTLGRLIQALGLIVIIWLIFQISNWFINRKRLKAIYEMKEDIKRIEKKINKLK